MKFLFVIFFIVLFPPLVSAQVCLPSYPDTLFSTYYYQRETLFEKLSQSENDIIFLGNSITDGAEWSELFSDRRMKNRGISGDITSGVIHRLNNITNGKPAKIFLLIGTNDLAKGISADSVIKNILLIADYVQQQSSDTKLFVQSILPVNDVYGKFAGHTGNRKKINDVNSQLHANATQHHYVYIDLNTSFCDANGKLNVNLTNDGLHLKGEGYLLWKHIIYPYVFSLQPKASLIPLPQQMQWNAGLFPLYNCKTIFTTDTVLQKDAEMLQEKLSDKGLQLSISNIAENNNPAIELKIEKISTAKNADESYHLEVTKQKVIITANTAHGIFNGIQTLLQLARDGTMIDACTITDAPAFAWRGYMIDVGRNFMSMHLLKQQIEMMSLYKLNIFHLHLTEDIAWRLSIKQYPQLTAPENMLRNKGMYYSQNDLKELIAFCKERYITLVPEIDMPGHSAAFKRAMGVDMQSDSGLAIIKNILKEICTTYDVPYIHIGADEVNITNKNFVPDITNYIQSLGRQVIGWQPGGNFTSNTIRQLWMDDNGKFLSDTTIRYIDSRHLYLNHMSPLESVVTIFFRQIDNKEKGNASALGGEICTWHDRAVAGEDDILKMNPVYPAMLAFAERSWRGGGSAGWVATVGEPGTVAARDFREFENRLLDARKENFSQLPFPYTAQSDIVWKLYGPYNNDGNLSKKFPFEEKNFDESKMPAALKVVGGAIILRHWWYPLIKGVIENPVENSTWYAVTKIWSDNDGEKNFWIGFNDLSRSPATNSPPANAWDDKQSKVWVNENTIAPPQWKHAGQKGNSEIPLIDEGYSYRKPTKIFLHKGWNRVLIKAPVGSFKGSDWQNPVKWMFTFVPL